MANSSLTIDMITLKALDLLEIASPLIRTINKQYDDKFAVTGAKIGATCRVRKPDRVLVTEGAALGVDDTDDQFTTVSITDQTHVGLNFTSAELALNIDDFADRHLKPRISQLAATIESKIAQRVYKKVWQSVGTPGTTPATSLVLLQAMQKLYEANTPAGMIHGVVNPAANASLVEGLKGLFNPTGTISKQFKTGLMGEGILGLDDISMGQGIYTHTRGTTPTAPIVAATVATQGQTTLDISFTSGSPTFKGGDVFTVAGVYMVNPQTRVSTGSLQQFVVDTDLSISSTTTGTLSFQPPLYTAEQALATVNAFPQSSAALVFMGATSGVYPQNLIFQKDSFTLATVDLQLPSGVQMASRQTYNGISMRIVKQYDINNDRLPCRVDVLYGIDTLRPETACRLWG